MNKIKGGISLIVLTVTIIVLAIIAGIVIANLQKQDILEESEETVTKYSDRVIAEEIDYYEISFAKTYKLNLTDAAKAKLKQALYIDGVKLDMLTVYPDGVTQEQHVLYVYSKVTSEIITKLEAININKLMGDLDFDGFLTTNDSLIANQAVTGSVTLTEEQEVLADMNNDTYINAVDALEINNLVNGRVEYDYE